MPRGARRGDASPRTVHLIQSVVPILRTANSALPRRARKRRGRNGPGPNQTPQTGPDRAERNRSPGRPTGRSPALTGGEARPPQEPGHQRVARISPQDESGADREEVRCAAARADRDEAGLHEPNRRPYPEERQAAPPGPGDAGSGRGGYASAHDAHGIDAEPGEEVGTERGLGSRQTPHDAGGTTPQPRVADLESLPGRPTVHRVDAQREWGRHPDHRRAQPMPARATGGPAPTPRNGHAAADVEARALGREASSARPPGGDQCQPQAGA